MLHVKRLGKEGKQTEQGKAHERLILFPHEKMLQRRKDTKRVRREKSLIALRVLYSLLETSKCCR